MTPIDQSIRQVQNIILKNVSKAFFLLISPSYY